MRFSQSHLSSWKNQGNRSIFSRGPKRRDIGVARSNYLFGEAVMPGLVKVTNGRKARSSVGCR